jgi:hypothetical protein
MVRTEMQHRERGIEMVKRSMFQVLVVAVMVMACAALPSFAAGGSEAKSSMKSMGERYMILMPHTQEQCLKALDDMVASSSDLLSMTEWGCMAGDHTGYVIVNAASEDAARAMIPAAERASARVIKLNKFTPEQIKSFHKTM